MRPGKTVFEWMQDHDVRSLGIDVRRFASFGVIKACIFSSTNKPNPHA
jgi:nitrogen permease regulator 2-like protein